MAPPPGKPMPSSMPRAFSPCRISPATPEASPSAISNGFRTGRGSSGAKANVNERLLDVMERSFDEVVRYAETTQGKQPDRRLHAGD